MKFSATLIAVFGIFLTLNAQKNNEKVVWYSIEEAIELSARNPKKIMIDVYTDWCGFCKRMEAETFSDARVARYINQNFYPVKFNSETRDTVYFQGQMFVNDGEGRRSPHQFSIALLSGQMSYPSVVYINEALELLTVVPGFMTPERIEPILKFIGDDHYQTRSWDDFQSSFTGTFK